MSTKFKDFQMYMPNTKKWTEDMYKDKYSIFIVSTFNGKNLPMGLIHFLKIKTNLIFMIFFFSNNLTRIQLLWEISATQT